jgi:adenylate cyclase
MKLGEAKKFDLAILHVDIDGFKKLVQGLTQNQYLRFVSIFLTEMTQLIDNRNGFVDRYVGDQVTALFGIGRSSSQGAEDCIYCALDMKTIIQYSINPFLKSIELPIFSCSFGMDLGDIWIAKVGIRGINQLTLIGYAVNIVAELVDIAPTGQIMLGHNLYKNLSDSNRNYCV